MNKYDEELKNAINDYSKLLFKISLDLVKNKEEAENLVQDAFLSYYKKLEEYYELDKESKKKILARIVINKAKDYLKSLSVKLRDASDNNEKINLIVSNTKVEEMLIKKEKKENVIKAINKLKEPYKTLIYSYYIEEYTLDEICEKTNTNKNVIKVQLTRAKTKLKEIIEDGGELYE